MYSIEDGIRLSAPLYMNAAAFGRNLSVKLKAES